MVSYSNLVPITDIASPLAIGGLLGFIGQPYVSGVMYSLMNQAIVGPLGPLSFQPPSRYHLL